jgi:hypothetical protein
LLDLGVEVVRQETDVRAASVLERASAPGTPGLLVLEQLEVVPVAGQVREPDVRAGDARDLLDVAALDLAVRDELEAEVAVEVQRGLEVGDRQREVMYPRDQDEPPSRYVVVWGTLQRCPTRRRDMGWAARGRR